MFFFRVYSRTILGNTLPRGFGSGGDAHALRRSSSLALFVSATTGIIAAYFFRTGCTAR